MRQWLRLFPRALQFPLVLPFRRVLQCLLVLPFRQAPQYRSFLPVLHWLHLAAQGRVLRFRVLYSRAALAARECPPLRRRQAAP